jgi:hypothetical protein
MKLQILNLTPCFILLVRVGGGRKEREIEKARERREGVGKSKTIK